MRAPARLALYGAGLVAVFAGAFVTANAVVPDETVQAWSHDADAHTTDTQDDANENDIVNEHQNEHSAHSADGDLLGLSSADRGYQLTEMHAPADADSDGELQFTITHQDDRPVTSFDVSHEHELHLIVVRSDGEYFRREHPGMEADGTWSIPWRWDAAGTYRVFADFVPAETGESVTLSTNVEVAGDVVPHTPSPLSTTSVDGYDVTLDGTLVAGAASRVTLSVSRDGEPVTTLEPGPCAFRHLVVLRDDDLAYLRAHPHGETCGPEITFEVTPPTAGRYLLYLDFQVDGSVRTASLAVDTADSGSADTTDDTTDDAHEEGSDHEH